MCGWLDVAQKQAELKPYREIAEQCQKRFGMRFEPTAKEYDALVHDFVNMLTTLGFKLVDAEDDEEHESESEVPESDGPSTVMRLGAAAVAALLVGAVIMLLR